MGWLRLFVPAALLLIVAASLVAPWGTTPMAHDWRTASREPVGIAPNPATEREAIIQVYGARAYGWRGRFGIHTWIAVKPTDATAFDVYEVIGWRAYRGMSAVSVSNRAADARWFGNAPEILAEARGNGVDAMIERLRGAARDYPYATNYTIWPGPNSNTFTAHMARALPELRLDLPATAIGKDYLPDGRVFASTPSGTGYQISLFGLFGILVGKEEGFEINLLGLVFGVDPLDLGVKLPLIGRLGADQG